MIGLEITGRRYNPDTYEVSRDPVEAKIIDTGRSSIKIWVNGSLYPSVFTVDTCICSTFNNSTGEYDSNNISIIPFYLVTTIISGTVDTSKYSLVSGKNTKFYTGIGEDFTTTDEMFTGGLIIKGLCPVVFFEETGSIGGRLYTSGDYLLCYPSIVPGEFDETRIIFIEEIKSSPVLNEEPEEPEEIEDPIEDPLDR
jgi:hypothetical protein